MLLALLVLPLYVPVLIIGAGAVEMAPRARGRGHLLMLGALLDRRGVRALGIAAALRIAME